MEVTVGISNRHVHLSKEVYEQLFNKEEFRKVKELAQPGEFASDKKVTIKTEKSIIENVRILGPLRSYTQVEISKTDAFKLGINAPIRNSGDLKDSASVTLVVGEKEVKLNEGCIIPTRHIHITQAQKEAFGFGNVEKVAIKVIGEKGGIFNNVYLKVAPNSFFELHVDTDDGNAFQLNQGSIVEIISED